MQLKLTPMAGSAGLILPDPILIEMGVDRDGSFEADLVDGTLVLSVASTRPRAGWAKAAQAVALASDDGLAWPEFDNADDEFLRW